MLLYLRAFLFYAGHLATTLVMFPVLMLSAGLPPLTRARIASVWPATLMPWLRITCGIDCAVTGQENIPDTPGVMLVKHQSAWETMFLQLFTPPQVWVLKKELLYIPIYGWGLWSTGPIAIDRSAGFRALDQVVEQGKRKLVEGRWVVVFPEGTRMPHGETGKYSAGGAKLAIDAGVPVLPVAHNAGKFWPRRSFVKYPGTVRLAIGPPITTAGKSPKQVTAEAKQWIENEIASWG